MQWYRHKVWSPYILNMVLFLRAILHQQPDHTMSCNHLNLGIRKGYKTSFQKSGHNCDPAGLTKKDLQPSRLCNVVGPQLLEAERCFLEIFTDYSTMLLVFGVQNSLAQTIQKESYEFSNSGKWKGYKSLFVRPVIQLCVNQLFVYEYKCMLKQNLHYLNTCASFITKCSDKYSPFICLNCCSNRPYTAITEHIKNSYKVFSYIIYFFILFICLQE